MRNVNFFFTFKTFLQTVETQTKPRNSTFATIYSQKSKTTTKKQQFTKPCKTKRVNLLLCLQILHY